ncbi:MAG: hypothetical protein WBP82_09145 [Leuconostoc mesenteroides]
MINDLNLQELHTLIKLNNRCTPTNDCQIDTQFGPVIIEQTTEYIYTAKWKHLSSAGETPTNAFLKVAKLIKLEHLIDQENY